MTTSSAASETLRARNGPRRTVGAAGQHLGPAAAAAAGQVHVEQHHVGPLLVHHGDRLLHRCGLPDHRDARVEVGLEPGAEDGVVIDDDHATGVLHAHVIFSLGVSSWTGAPRCRPSCC